MFRLASISSPEFCNDTNATHFDYISCQPYSTFQRSIKIWNTSTCTCTKKVNIYIRRIVFYTHVLMWFFWRWVTSGIPRPLSKSARCRQSSGCLGHAKTMANRITWQHWSIIHHCKRLHVYPEQHRNSSVTPLVVPWFYTHCMYYTILVCTKPIHKRTHHRQPQHTNDPHSQRHVHQHIDEQQEDNRVETALTPAVDANRCVHVDRCERQHLVYAAAGARRRRRPCVVSAWRQRDVLRRHRVTSNLQYN